MGSVVLGRNPSGGSSSEKTLAVVLWLSSVDGALWGSNYYFLVLPEKKKKKY